MSTKLAALAILAIVAVGLTSAAVAGPSSKTRPQRVVITAANGGDNDNFVLRPLKAGKVSPDSGTRTACCWTRHFIVRDGQKIEINNPLLTYTGKLGTFTSRARIAWVDAGNGYTIGTGTWKVVKGTGAYLHFRGHGRLAINEQSWQAEGYLGPR